MDPGIGVNLGEVAGVSNGEGILKVAGAGGYLNKSDDIGLSDAEEERFPEDLPIPPMLPAAETR